MDCPMGIHIVCLYSILGWMQEILNFLTFHDTGQWEKAKDQENPYTFSFLGRYFGVQKGIMDICLTAYG